MIKIIKRLTYEVMLTIVLKAFCISEFIIIYLLIIMSLCGEL